MVRLWIMAKKEKKEKEQSSGTNGFLNLLKQFSLIAYVINLKEQITEEAARSSAEFLKANENMSQAAKKDIASFEALSAQIQKTAKDVNNSPRAANPLEFVDNKGRSDAQMREYQLNILASQQTITNNILRDYQQIDAEGNVWGSWYTKMLCNVRIHPKKHYDKAVIGEIQKNFTDYGFTSDELQRAIQFGLVIEKPMPHEDAAYLVQILQNHHIEATYYLHTYEAAQKRAVPEEDDMRDIYKKIAFRQRILITILWVLFWAIIAVIFHHYENPTFLVLISIFTVGFFLALWLVSYLTRFVFVKIIYQIVKRVFRPMNDQYFPLATEYVIDQVKDVYNPTMEKLTTNFFNSYNLVMTNFDNHDKCMRSFLPPEVIDGNWIPFICKQMLIGANYNEAIWRAQQVQDREKWKQEKRALEAKRDKESREFRARMLAEQERRTEYARQAEIAARQAAADASAAKSAAREAERYEKEQKEILNQIRNDINRY